MKAEKKPGIKKRIRNRRDPNNPPKNTVPKISGPLLFGLKLLSVENVRKVLPLNHNPRIRPFGDLSISTKRRKVLKIAQQVLDTVEEEKENIFHLDDCLKIKQARFEIGGAWFDVSFGNLDEKSEEERKKAIVKSLDDSRITREGYRSLARIEQDLPRERAIFEMRQKINLEMNNQIPLSLVDIVQPTVFEPITDVPDITDVDTITNVLESIGKGGQRRITDILNYIIPFYVKKGILIPENSILYI
jgi:hypothetical protein